MHSISKEHVLDSFSKGYGCGQFVAEQFTEETGLSIENLRKLAACFDAGMLRGETCGAVIAAYNVIGLIYGQCEEYADEQKGIMMTRMLRFNELFNEKYDSFICEGLLGANISTAEGGKKIAEQNLLTKFCPEVVSYVVDILEQVINE